MKRFSPPWMRAKRGDTLAASDLKQHTIDEQEDGSVAVHPQTSSLLSLPMELRHRILDFVLTRWSMAVLHHDDEAEYILDLDDTFSLRTAGPKLLSGPPGCELLLVCRAMYHTVYQRYGESCTGKLILGRVKGYTRRKLPSSLTSQIKLKRFYDKIHSISVHFSLDNGKFGMNFRKLFPNLRYASCLVHEGGYGPLLRLNDTVASFLRGDYDRELLGWTRPTVNCFIGLDSRSISSLHDRSSPWDDKDAVVDVKVLGSFAKTHQSVLGFTYRWEGTQVRVTTRVVRDRLSLKYWEEGVGSGTFYVIDLAEDHVPWRFRWVQVLRW